MTQSALKHTSFLRPYSAMRFTSTAKYRNDAVIERLFNLYQDRCVESSRTVKILEIGPGACTKYFGENHWGQRIVDKIVRRLPLPFNCYESYETSLLRTTAFKHGFYPSITVVDISKKVLRIVRSGNEFEDVRFLQRDICESPRFIGHDFDMVICLNVLMHLRHRETPEAKKGHHHVIDLCRPGGLIAASPLRVFHNNQNVTPIEDLLYKRQQTISSKILTD
ncbi:MAG: SAM-dependent methyltransferase [Parasphingorhabdus sp.]|jgi:SAM-dependent methyltransferase